MVAYDYSRLADLYDTFCVFGDDLELFRRRAAEASGRVLELMAGTGRVSAALAAAGVEPVCVDLCPAMLAVLRRKLPGRAAAVCADATALPLAGPFALVVLAFHALAELVDVDAQAQLMREVHRVLAPNGRFVCTCHNPAVRRRAVDGTWRSLGTFPRPDGGRVEAALCTWAAGGHRVAGRQRVRVLDAAGAVVEEREVALEFTLTPPEAVLAIAAAAGLRPLELLGDYQASPWDPATSPYLVAVLGRDAEPARA